MMLDAALALARNGWHVFPLAARSKKTIKGTHGFKDATRDADKIVRWWREHPRANIGIACGPSCVVAIDLDVKNGAQGIDNWIKLCYKLGIDDLETLTVDTPSGGHHIYFGCPAGVKVGNSTGDLPPGIDVRARGGYTVAPPSVTPQGRYTWGMYTTIVPLPAVLLKVLQPARKSESGCTTTPKITTLPRYVQTAIEQEASIVARARPGTRNRVLNRASFSLGTLCAALWSGLDEMTAKTALMQAAAACGLPDWEANKTINSGLAAGMNKPRPQPGGHR